MLDRLARKSTSSAGAGAIPGAGSDEKGSGRGVLQRLAAGAPSRSTVPRRRWHFCAVTLNYLTLQPGEAVFLSAMVPHAYLSGDIVDAWRAATTLSVQGLRPNFVTCRSCVIASYMRARDQWSSSRLS